MSSIHIREIHSKEDIRRFVAFPFRLYKGCPYWIPPIKAMEETALDPEKNPAFQHCEAALWVAEKSGRIAGRICCFFNDLETQMRGEKQARFNWIDFEDDPGVSRALLETAEKWAKDGKFHRLDGPAVIYSNGSKEWWQNGRLHRKDGPAVEIAEGFCITYAGREQNEQKWKDWKSITERMHAEEIPSEKIERGPRPKTVYSQIERPGQKIYIETREWWHKGKKRPAEDHESALKDGQSPAQRPKNPGKRPENAPTPSLFPPKRA